LFGPSNGRSAAEPPFNRRSGFDQPRH